MGLKAAYIKFESKYIDRNTNKVSKPQLPLMGHQKLTGNPRKVGAIPDP